jgi:Rieske Fe-S protein
LVLTGKKDNLANELEGLSNESGTVIENEKLAVYKDGKGELQTFSAKCTHLGCTVKWNELEKSFDCPCHGSRFQGLTGNVINGPANTSLEINNKKIQ